MQEIEAATQPTAMVPATIRRSSPPARWIFLAISIITLLLLALLPPFISVNRYGHRISTSIGTTLGRPVHFDHVSLNLLPVPSFTITNFVVEEDAAFGSEPIIRANSVTANLRFRSLWRRRIEFARISFTEASINLVHDSRGKWNFETILLQAAQINSAPTAQPGFGSAPHFPYIEATRARINFKRGIEKTPFSLTEADLALWLPEPSTWRMRVSGRPVRTDTSTSDTGILQIEANLGRAPSLNSVPLHVEASWSGAPLGEASHLVAGHDLGLRGDIAVTAIVNGTLALNTLQTHLGLNRFRRADFVPDQTLDLSLDCTATAVRAFHQLHNLRCTTPIPDSNGATLALAGSLPDVLYPASADLQLGTARLPASVLLTWLRVASPRLPSGVTATGLFSGSLAHETSISNPNRAANQPPASTATASSYTSSTSSWVGQATLPDLALAGNRLGNTPLIFGSIFLHSVTETSDRNRSHRTLAPPASAGVVLAPLSLSLGGKEPAMLEGFADASGYSLHLSGMVALGRLSALASAVPQFGDGLELVLPINRILGPVRVDLSSHRPWLLQPPSRNSQPVSPLSGNLQSGLQLSGIQPAGVQVWTDNLAHAGAAPSHPRSAIRSRRKPQPRR